MSTVAIIDYGMGNLRSVAKAIEHVAPAATVVVTADPAEVLSADRVVFPGQGAMPDCMAELDARGLRPAVLEAARSKPFLGICIGQQMLFEHSEEGNVPGLGIFKGEVRRFPADKMVAADGSRLKVPHMGWNEVWQAHTFMAADGLEQAAKAAADKATAASSRPPGSLRKLRSSQSNATRKRARKPVCSCCRTSCPGSPDLPPSPISPSRRSVSTHLSHFFLCC